MRNETKLVWLWAGFGIPFLLLFGSALVYIQIVNNENSWLSAKCGLTNKTINCCDGRSIVDPFEHDYHYYSNNSVCVGDIGICFRASVSVISQLNFQTLVNTNNSNPNAEYSNIEYPSVVITSDEFYNYSDAVDWINSFPNLTMNFNTTPCWYHINYPNVTIVLDIPYKLVNFFVEDNMRWVILGSGAISIILYGAGLLFTTIIRHISINSPKIHPYSYVNTKEYNEDS